MTSPLFDILKRNMGIPDVDRGDYVPTPKKPRKKSPRKASKRFIDGWMIANELVQSGMSRFQASRLVASKYNIGYANLYRNWGRIEADAEAHFGKTRQQYEAERKSQL